MERYKGVLEGFVVGYFGYEDIETEARGSFKLALSLDVDGKLISIVEEGLTKDRLDKQLENIKQHQRFFRRSYAFVNLTSEEPIRNAYPATIERITNAPREKIREFRERKKRRGAFYYPYNQEKHKPSKAIL